MEVVLTTGTITTVAGRTSWENRKKKKRQPAHLCAGVEAGNPKLSTSFLVLFERVKLLALLQLCQIHLPSRDLIRSRLGYSSMCFDLAHGFRMGVEETIPDKQIYK